MAVHSTAGGSPLEHESSHADIIRVRSSLASASVVASPEILSRTESAYTYSQYLMAPNQKKSSVNAGLGTKKYSMAGRSNSNLLRNPNTRRRQSLFGRTGLASEVAPSPVVQVSTGTLQYNGPHCIGVEDDRLEITHGMHKDYSIRLSGHIKTVLFYPKIKSCTVLYAGGICRYNSNELCEEFHDASVIDDIDKLLHSTELGVYVGVCKLKMKLLNRSFQLLHEAESPGRITAAVFNQHSCEVVTASPGKIVVCP